MKLRYWGYILLVLLAGIWLYTQLPHTQTKPLTSLSGNLNDFFNVDPWLEASVNRWYEQLTPTQRAGQLIMPAWDPSTDPHHWVKAGTVGGVMLINKNLTPDQVSSLKVENTGNPLLLIASDAEPSLLKYRFKNPPYSGKTSDLSDTKLETVSYDIAEFLHRYQVNLNFAPVYDLGVNQSVIGTRAFSDDPELVIKRANEMAQIFQSENIIPTAKHFPGHGLVIEDTHQELATISGSLSELPLFESAIKNNIPVMMIGHLAIETKNLDTGGLPSTLSEKIMKSLLRDQLVFRGIIITDAMNMKAVSDIPNVDLKALQAGADIVLMPIDPTTLNQEIVEIMRTDPEMFEAKIKRVLRLKLIWALSAD